MDKKKSIENDARKLTLVVVWMWVPLFLLSLGMVIATTASAVTLTGGDILVVNDILWGGTQDPAVYKVDPSTGAQTTVTSGGLLQHPEGIAVEADGNILVADRAAKAVFRVEPSSGTQTTVTSGGLLNGPFGIAIEADGNILVVDYYSGKLVRVDPVTGAQTPVSYLIEPISIAVEGDGNILVVDLAPGALIRVDPVTGAQTILSGSIFHNDGIAVEPDGDIVVSRTGSPAVILRIDPVTGAQTIITSGGLLLSPAGVAIEVDGNIVLADRGSDTDPGRIFRIDPVTGAQTTLSSGGALLRPTHIAIVVPTVTPIVCEGFEMPFHVALMLRKKVKRTIPVKMKLVDSEGIYINDQDLTSPPVINIIFTPGGGGSAQDLTDQLLPNGAANEDNIFRFDAVTSTWIYNLGAKQFQAAGRYEVTVAPGDATYTIETCMGMFERGG